MKREKKEIHGKGGGRNDPLYTRINAVNQLHIRYDASSTTTDYR